MCGSAWWKGETFQRAEMDYSWKTHLLFSIHSLDMLVLRRSSWGLITPLSKQSLRKLWKVRGGKMFPSHPWLKFTHSNSLASEQHIIILELFISKWSLRESVPSHLERLKPAKPEWEASSISGVTIRSIMSVSTVKVGTTMKSINPGDKQRT